MSKKRKLEVSCVCSGRKMPPRCAFYAGEMIKCRMLGCVTPACHLQEMATFLENWLVRTVAVFTFDCVRRRARVCAHLSSLRLNVHACTRACVYLSIIEREQEQQCVSM